MRLSAITQSPCRVALAVAALMAAAAGAAASDTQRANVSSGGAQGNAAAFGGSVTPDGRFVVVQSSATNLVTGDTNGFTDVFVRDRLLNTIARVSLPDPSMPDAQANAGSFLNSNGGRAISDDGRFVIFMSEASNLVPDDINDVSDIFVRDRDFDGNGIFDEPGPGKTRTLRVNLTTSGGQAFGGCPGGTCTHGSFNPTISASGRYVAWSSEFNFTNDSVPFANVYWRDRVTSITRLVSKPVNCVGCEQNGYSDSPVISGDGRWVAFISRSTHLVFSDTNNADDIFVRDIFDASSFCVRMSVSATGDQGQSFRHSFSPAISHDGRFVAFASTNDGLIAGDTGQTDIFVRDRDANNSGVFDQVGAVTLERVSLGWSAFPLPSGSTVPLNGHSGGTSISADGRFVAFHSDATNFSCGLLGCDDQNGFRDVFVRDRVAGVTRRVSVSPAGAEGNERSEQPHIDPTGRFIGFRTRATNLTGTGDSNGNSEDVLVRSVSGEPNALCAGAFPATTGSYFGDTYGAGTEGGTTCVTAIAPDVWYTYTAPCTGKVVIDTAGSSYDTVLSVHSACPGTSANQIVCNDDAPGFGLQSRVEFFATQGQTYTIRVSGFNIAAGFYVLNIGPCQPCCPGNADKIAPGEVNFADITAALVNFGAAYGLGTGPGDANCDGQVNFGDITEILLNFGGLCN